MITNKWVHVRFNCIGIIRIKAWICSTCGEKTGIELANEVPGDIEIMYESELATASFGQGISVTPIQIF